MIALMTLAGVVGALARFVLDGAMRVRRGTVFPYPTAVINVSGSLLLGILTGLVLFRGAPGDLKMVLGTGFCGGYTTFSTASVETVRLLQLRRYAPALTNAFGSLVVTVAAGALGLWIVS